MPIYVGADNIIPVNIGKVSVTSAYVGADKVYEFDPNQILTLVSAEDFDLKTFIDASSADYSKPIIINMASDQVIGGVNGFAFNIASLPAHSNITINVNGQIQGRTGYHAVASDEPLDIISTGQIAGGIADALVEGEALITFIISATGKVLAGGGNGGAGGKGGDGDGIFGWQDFRWNTNTSYPLYYYNASTSSSRWNDTNIGPGLANTIYQFSSATGSLAVYEKGKQKSGTLHEINKATLSRGTGGAGGAGGLGAGYNQSRTDGENGLPGTAGDERVIEDRSGDGGQGGNGGDWGVSGSKGQDGAAGLYYSSTSSEAVRFGQLGTVGVDAGLAFYMPNSTFSYYGPESAQAKALGI